MFPSVINNTWPFQIEIHAAILQNLTTFQKTLYEGIQAGRNGTEMAQIEVQNEAASVSNGNLRQGTKYANCNPTSSLPKHL